MMGLLCACGTSGPDATTGVSRSTSRRSRPEGVPEEHWLPITRRDGALDAVMRIYAPDLDRLATWKAPEAERVELQPL